ncbi:hypothetical protein EG329_011431 [Mollisiaceae sp. DMI_Dod_QoI]|nr:hypothetical protein EG329_011431 [Helotiales sp. DMI_Dod_QoI]
MATTNVPYEMRNAEEVHKAMLLESKNYHDNLRKEAERVLATHMLEEHLKELKLQADHADKMAKLQCAAIAEKQRIQDAEARQLEAQAKLREAEKKKREAEIKAREAENAAKSMPPIPPRVATPPPPAPKATPVNQPTAGQQAPAKSASELSASQSATNTGSVNQSQATPQAQPPPNPFAQAKPSTQSLFAQSQPSAPQPTPPSLSQNPFAPKAQSAAQPAAQNPFTPATQPTPAAQPAPSQPNGQLSANQQGKQPDSEGTRPLPVAGFSAMVDLPETKRYIDIHLQLKMLRAQVKPKGKETGPLKVEAGNQGRAIRIAIGQLSAGKGNAVVFTKLRDIFKASLAYRADIGQGPQIVLIDPSPYVVRTPAPLTDPEAKNNGDQLPVLFIYLLSVFAKALVAQAAQESSAKPETAEPIALAAHQVFSHPDLLWRGMSMIDILVAKLRKSCGSLFGFRGAETKDTGRRTLGWKQEDGIWISEELHYDRMRGIGAFYASLCLRQYKNRVNPYPPHHYWRAMAAILSCPQQERSNTSYYVLIALIQGYEQKFLHFYGDMARYALEAALIEYPKGAREMNTAVMSLVTLGEKIQKEGLNLPQ